MNILYLPINVLRRPLESAQYTSIRYTDRLVDAGLSASVGTIGDSYDNAMAEALNGTFKAELIKLHGPWRTRHQLEIAIIEWVDWYNHRRIHSEIGDLPPAELETNWYRQQDLAPQRQETHNPHCTKPGALRECRKDGVTGIWSEKVSNGSPESRTNVRTIECLDD